MDFSLIWSSLPRMLTSGLPLTLQLVALALLFGFVMAVCFAMARRSGSPLISGPARAYVFVFRGTPLLIQIALIYYGLGQFKSFWESVGLWGILREAYWCAIIALAMNNAAYASEIIRGGMQSVPYGSVEAARACGMSRWTTFRRIIFPIAIRQALPGYGNEIILMVKATALASTITLMELTGIALQIRSKTLAPYESFIAAGAIYLLLNFLITRAIKYTEWRLTPYLRERPAASPIDSAR